MHHSKSRLLGVLLITFILTLPSFSFQSASQWNYSEDLNISLAGSAALWKITFTGGNVTLPGLDTVEAEFEGTDRYNIFAAKTLGWSPEYEVFSTNGLNLFGFDQIPAEGVFLEIEASTRGDAFEAAMKLNSILGLAFVEYSSEEGRQIFYSNADFSHLVTNYLWNAVPTSLGGYVKLVDQKAFPKGDVAFITFTGKREGDSFSHSIALGGVVKEAVQKSQWTLERMFKDVRAVRSSTFSNSTTIKVTVYNGYISEAEGGELSNYYGDFTGNLFASIQLGEPLPILNTTLGQEFPSLIAIREVDKAVISAGDEIEVRLTIRNAAPSTAPRTENVTVHEDWWTQYFDRVDQGPDSWTVTSLSPGEEKSFAYQLKAKSLEGEVRIVQSEAQNRVPYSYRVGDKILQGEAIFNPLEIWINADRPTITMEADTQSTTTPIGSSLPITLNIWNLGSKSAFNLKLYLKDELISETDALLPGHKWTVTSNISTASIMEFSKKLNWIVEWRFEGRTETTRSNSINLFYSFSNPTLPSLALEKSAETETSQGKIVVNVTVKATNNSPFNLTKVLVRDKLPEKMKYIDGNFTLGPLGLEAEIENLNAKEARVLRYKAEILDPDENYVLTPSSSSVQHNKIIFSRLSASTVLPLGVKVTKTISPSIGLENSTAKVTIAVINRGKLPIFNVNVTSAIDRFFALLEGKTSNSTNMLASGESLESSYSVKFISSGDHLASHAETEFRFAGVLKSTNTSKIPLRIFDLPSATILIDPAQPLEGTIFSITVMVKNPTNETITDLVVKTKIPSGLESIEDKSLNLEGVQLEGDKSLNVTAKFKSGEALDFVFEPPEISFTYRGQTFLGKSQEAVVHVSDNMVNRYGVPIGVAVVIALVTLFMVRRAVKTP